MLQGSHDSGFRVTIIFKSWYSHYLSHVPVQPVTNLATWGLSGSDYPYKGYVVVDLEFPAKFNSATETISVLALIFPDPKSPDPFPVFIIGTNSKKLHYLLNYCKEPNKIDGTYSLRVLALNPEQPDSLNKTPGCSWSRARFTCHPA